jgi:hypothetical protein
VTSPSLTEVSSLINTETYDPVIVNIIPDADANSPVPSPSLSNDERSEITDNSSDIDAFNEPSVHSTSALLENIPYDELLLGDNVKDTIVDTNLDATPENMLQSQQARPHTHVFQKHTYSFSHDMSIATGGRKKDLSMETEKLTQTSSVAVSFNQPYPHIDIGMIMIPFNAIISMKSSSLTKVS